MGDTKGFARVDRGPSESTGVILIAFILGTSAAAFAFTKSQPGSPRHQSWEEADRV